MSTRNVDDLLVFGYACKIFRDDEKALHIDQGKHLIAWMGDSTLKIDRYDVRATLPDISQFEPPLGGYENRLEFLDPAEQRAEQLCEKERYFSLYNDFEEELYKEENKKRSNIGYGQVGFNYDQSTTSNFSTDELVNSEGENKNEQPDEAYVPHPRFYIPPNIELPETTKVQAIIEKTARFIAMQGPQMEILIKAKQANNPLFDFLNQRGRLNPFYKHTLQSIKDGNYPSDNTQECSVAENSSEPAGSIYQNYYSSNTTMVSVPTIKYKPSADCAYTQLISKIKGVHEQAKPSTANVQQIETAVAKQSKTDVEVKKISNGLMLAQYYNSESEDEEENQNKCSENDDAKNSVSQSQQTNGKSQTELSSISTLSEDFPVPAGILCPAPELRVIIDKTASYVLKNGKDFEDILREKNDERFTFLQYRDPHYNYYTFKLTGIVFSDPANITTTNSVRSEIETPMTSKSNSCKSSGEVEASKLIAPVSFSIKSKEDSSQTTLKPALPQEHSSDEESLLDCNKKNDQNSDVVPKELPVSSNLRPFSLPNSNSMQTVDEKANNSSTEIDHSDSFIRDAILEQQNLNDKKLIKRAEDRVRDRLAQLAREKLGILSKEKQLQLERKRRAMAFLNQISSDENTNAKTMKKEKDDLIEQRPGETSLLKEQADTADHSDSSDSVKFVMETTCSSVIQRAQKRRNIRVDRKSSESDDVVEIDSNHSRSIFRPRSRSKSTSSKRHRHKTKRSKKKSSKRRSHSRSYSRSMSRSRSERRSRSHDNKRKRQSSSSKTKKNRFYDD